jgi:hypothetical protein
VKNRQLKSATFTANEKKSQNKGKSKRSAHPDRAHNVVTIDAHEPKPKKRLVLSKEPRQNPQQVQLDLQKDLPLPKPRSELTAALSGLRAAMDTAAAAYENGRIDLDKCCDDYTTAAKNFAALILAERIRRSFERKVDSVTGKSTESVDEKIQHAKEVRMWLASWNFALRDPSSHQALGIRGYSNRTRGGAFRLSAFGKSKNLVRPTSWESIRALVLSPVLCDVTAEVHERDFSLDQPSR